MKNPAVVREFLVNLPLYDIEERYIVMPISTPAGSGMGSLSPRGQPGVRRWEYVPMRKAVRRIPERSSV